MMVEGCMWEEALYLCDLAINCNKETPEGWYLYAFCSFESQLYQQAWDGIRKLEKMDLEADKELKTAAIE